MVYCGGCGLALEADVAKVPAKLKTVLGETSPFIGTLTFGEQGCFGTDNEGQTLNRHGNLMFTLAVFGPRE